MEIKFETTKEDLIDFNLFVVGKSASARKSLLIQKWMGPVLLLLAAVLLNHFENEPVIIFIIFVLMGLLWVVFYPKYFRYTIKSNVSKMLDEGVNKSMMGKHTIIINQNEIIEVSEIGESRTHWNGIRKLEITGKHIYLFFGEIMAYIIPVRAFSGMAQMDEWVELVKENMASS